MRNLSSKDIIAALESKIAKLQGQVDTQAETITRLNHENSRLRRGKMHFKNKCNQLSDEKDHWKNMYLEVESKRRGGGK